MHEFLSILIRTILSETQFCGKQLQHNFSSSVGIGRQLPQVHQSGAVPGVGGRGWGGCISIKSNTMLGCLSKT